MEHALNTSGDPYLQTPEDDLSLIALYGWDIAIALSLPLLSAMFALFCCLKLKKKSKGQSCQLVNARPLVLDSHVGVHASVTIKGGGVASKDKTV